VTNPDTFLDDVLIPHKAFQAATDRLEMFFQSAQSMREPICFALLGPSGSGKSRVLETVYQRHQPSRGRDGLNIPIIRVSVPSKPTIKGLGDLILKEIDKNDDRKATENQLTRRIQVLMKNCGTGILMLDEFQHFYDKHSQVVWHHVADWLKVLVDSVRCVLVVAGLPECSAVIEQNEQLMRRFRAPIRLPRFSWQEDSERNEFIACLEAFHEVINDHFNVPRFYEDPWAFRCYCATGGLIGYLKNLLSELLVHSVVNNKKKLDLADFDIAYMNALYSANGCLENTLRPFCIDFQLVESVDVLNAARMVGRSDPVRNLAHKDMPLMSRKRTPRVAIRTAR
jgi:hypothetical protein